MTNLYPKHLIVLAASLIFPLLPVRAQNSAPVSKPTSEGQDPTQLLFHRVGVRRFIFTDNITLSSLLPGEIVRMSSMHPSFDSGVVATPGKANPQISGETINIRDATAAIYVGGVNPFATYEVDIREMQGESEVAVDLATLGLGRRVQAVSGSKGVLMRLVRGGSVETELPFSDKVLKPPYLLRVQLFGFSIAVFATKNGETTLLGYTKDKEDFKKFIDFRDRKVAADSTFNVATKCGAGGQVILGGAKSFLSPGIGQADIRMVNHKDGSPYLDNSRLWFTFTCRGILQPVMGVMSLDPSVLDLRFEGLIVFDFGDGLLRNDGPGQLFYDDDAKIWRAVECDFGGVRNRDGRSGSCMVVAESGHDPRHGFSVMGNARQLTGIEGPHEDPSLIYDSDAKMWRLATCSLKGFHTELFESSNWDGPFTKIAGPTKEDSTGVLIQKIGNKRYVFSGNFAGPMLIYSYPELAYLSNMKLDLPAHWPGAPGRGWPNVFPLPAGFPYRYMALMMDRVNFPEVKGANWSYGGLYLFGAYTDDISNTPYEFSK